MTNTIAEIIGMFAGILGVIAWLPQLKRVWIEKKHDGISLPTFSVVTIALILWLIYGILIGSPSVIGANVAALTMILALIVGVVVVEVVFVYPGVGQLMVDSVIKRDIPVVQGCALVFALTYILLNLIADVISIITNPRLLYPK